MKHMIGHVLLGWVLCLLSALPGRAAEPLDAEALAARIVPPYSLGTPVNDKGVWTVLNSGGAVAGYVFETAPLAPLPGFSGGPIDLLAIIDTEGRFLDVQLISQHEPIFVSGLGEAPFRKFLEQYRGLSITDTLVVGSPYGADAGSSLVYLDGVTKATASVRIAHESLLAATLAVAREKMQGIASAPPAAPDPDYREALDWEQLVEEGIASRLTVTNAEIDAAFAGTLWASDDPVAGADPDGVYLDLWLVDIGPLSVAKAVLSPESLVELEAFSAISGSDEPLLLIDAGRHGLVSSEFVRNTAPDLLLAEQDGLPVSLRDADLSFELAADLPLALRDGTAMILRTDRRLGLDPIRPWTLKVLAVRKHGMMQPEIGKVTLPLTHQAPERFFRRAAPVTQLPPWREAIRNRQADLYVLAAACGLLLLVLGPGMTRLAAHPHFPAIRLGVLAGVLGFVGWWGQGQLSIVTVLGILRTALQGGSYGFLLYDPFSLLLWGVTIAGFILWGRGLFCGWLCPFGALQEFSDRIGRALRLPQITVSVRWDRRLQGLKYVLLAAMIATVIVAPERIDTVAEIEPFKTAITVHFQREWIYVAYAGFWLGLGLFLFKGFCRYVCPLGAVMAIGGMLRGRDWIARRADCGSPCQLCRVKCRYGAIEKTGRVRYSECFQCLDCVTIHDDPAQCVPLILAAKRTRRSPSQEAHAAE